MADGRLRMAGAAVPTVADVESEDEVDDARVVWEQEDLLSQWASGKGVSRQDERWTKATRNVQKPDESKSQEHDTWITRKRSTFSHVERSLPSPAGTSKEEGTMVQIQPEKCQSASQGDYLATQHERCLRERETNVPVVQPSPCELGRPIDLRAGCPSTAPKGAKKSRRGDCPKTVAKKKRFSIISPVEDFDVGAKQGSQDVENLWKAMDKQETLNGQHCQHHLLHKNAERSAEERDVLGRKSTEFSNFLESLEPQSTGDLHRTYFGNRKSRKALRPGLSSCLARVLSYPRWNPLQANRIVHTKEPYPEPGHYEFRVTRKHFQAHLVLHYCTRIRPATNAHLAVIVVGNTKLGDKNLGIGSTITILPSHYEEAMEIQEVKCLLQQYCKVNNIHGIQNSYST